MGFDGHFADPCGGQEHRRTFADVLAHGQSAKADLTARMRLRHMAAIIPSDIPIGAFIRMFIDKID